MTRFFASLIFLSILFIGIATYGDEPKTDVQYKIESLLNIPENDVNCIYRDSKGFMWIGTLDGLHRYDGYGFKSYRISNQPNSISSNMIIAIDEDSYGNIWVGTYGKGISKLDPVTENFYNFFSDKQRSNNISNDVSTLLVDSNNNIWLGNWLGISRIKFKNKMSEIDVVDIFPTNDNEVEQGLGTATKTIFEDQSGTIWIGMNQGLKRVINPNGNAKKVRFEFINGYGENICQFKDGIITGGYLVSEITKNENNRYQSKVLLNIPVRVSFFHDGLYWAGGRDGVSVYEMIDGKLVQKMSFQKDFTEHGLNSNIITSFEVDENDRIWVGTRGGGVNIISNRQNTFRHYNRTPQKGTLPDNLTRSIFEDSNENLWIGFEADGITYLSKDEDYSSGFIRMDVNTYNSENRAYAIEEVLTPESDKQQSVIWVGTSFPTFITAINSTTKTLKPASSFTSALGFVFALENVGDSVLWAGTYSEGLWKLSLDKNGEVANAEQYTPQTSRTGSISSYIIRSILLDSKRNLWVGTDKGLNLIRNHNLLDGNVEFEIFTQGKEEHQLSFDYILQIMESEDGTIWLGTMGGGLIKCTTADNEQGYSFETITTENGLPNNSIKSIVEDEQNFLWLSSNHGLSRYNPSNGNIVNYDKEDGLQEHEFSEICGLKRKNGEIVFGGINGINVFKSENIEGDTTKPKLFLTEFLIDNKEVKPGEKNDGSLILEKSLEHTKEIKLKYSQNSFSIGFVGLHLLAPQKNNYRYMLEGFDEQWYKASPQYRVAKYTNIPAGNYTFKLIASNSNNIWTDEPKAIKIVISPPPYFSPFAIILYFVVLMTIILVLFRFYSIISFKKKEVLIANVEKEKVEELSQMKLKFFTNISHEFRTPLTLIKAPLDELKHRDRLLSEKSRIHNYNIISQNVNVLMRLINQLMDFRKLDQNKLKLNCAQYDLNGFINSIFQSFKPLADNKEITFTFDPPIDSLIASIDPIKFEKVVYNLLSNAFKFNSKGGNISIELEKNEVQGTVLMIVTDDGMGIKPEDAEHIFERYYQNDDVRKMNTGGTGIGLALSKGIVELHKGKIWFESKPDIETKCFVELPLSFPMSDDENQAFVASDYAPSFAENIQDNLEKEVLLTSGKTDIPKDKTILIVEDNLDLKAYLEEKMSCNFNVITAENGKEGVDLCKVKHPDLIITDVMMPVMTGIELCQLVKNNEEVSHTPILVLTAKDNEETQIEGFKTGADAYLTKPFNIDVLMSNIESLLSNREKLRKRFQKDIEINPKIISNSPADAKFLDKILALIEENLSDSDYTVEKIAESYGVSRIYLNRKIKALTGETTIEFMRNIKLKHAAELLKQNKLSVSEVAWEVGYNHMPTFRNRFKEKFEMSPSKFAKQYKE